MRKYKIEKLDLNYWRHEFGDKQIFLAAEEIIASGCEETYGSKYYEAAGNCYAQKLAKCFEEAPEGSPVKCREAVVLKCERSFDMENAYFVTFAIRAYDVVAFMEYTDLLAEMEQTNGENFPGYWGWLIYSGFVFISPSEDGGWIGDCRLHNWG
ncbi:MAG: hypothetical protein IKO51_01170 [Clostridia bacterium]|nr:hypothetical protein [Clostridia bacterium]